MDTKGIPYPTKWLKSIGPEADYLGLNLACSAFLVSLGVFWNLHLNIFNCNTRSVLSQLLQQCLTHSSKEDVQAANKDTTLDIREMQMKT